jgi:16S rRNA (uracil1498-N3)-methyltransferase
VSRLHRFLTTERHGDEVEFSTAQARQIERVLRLRPGDRVRAFDGEGPIDLVVVLTGPSVGHIVERCPQPPEPRTRLVAYPALLRRDKFEPVLRKLTELGVASIVPVLTARGLVREPPDAARLARWQAILQEATEQSGRGRVPRLHAAMQFDEAVRRASQEGATVLAYEEERHATLREALRDAGDTVSIFVGPEGGYTREEARLAREIGARVITLGPRVLRTETASPVLAALVLHERGDLSSLQNP